jgi:hypothetical protein
MSFEFQVLKTKKEMTTNITRLDDSHIVFRKDRCEFSRYRASASSSTHDDKFKAVK